MSKLTLEQEALRRRTFAIIAHPDAGKTTLTEHILLAGGAIRAAGAVRARGETHSSRRPPWPLPPTCLSRHHRERRNSTTADTIPATPSTPSTAMMVLVGIAAPPSVGG